jgi:uncharacterized protein
MGLWSPSFKFTSLKAASLKLAYAGLGVAVVAVNGVAWMQARGMTHYLPTGERTARPETLTWLDKAKLLLLVQLPRPENQQTPASFALAYSTHQINLTQAPQEWLETWYIPAPKPANLPSARPATPDTSGLFLLFPPYGGSKDSILAVAKALQELGYATLLVDYRGVGGSSGDRTTIGIREADDVAAAMQFAQTQWPQQPIYLYGASMGGAAVARAVALKGLRPRAIILESAFDRLSQTIRHRFQAMGWPSSPATELMLFWGGLQQNIDAFAHNPVDYAKSITTPTLIFYGQADQRVTLAETQAIFTQLAGKKQLSLFNGIGHGGLAAEETVQWKQQVQVFLQSLPPSNR